MARTAVPGGLHQRRSSSAAHTSMSACSLCASAAGHRLRGSCVIIVTSSCVSRHPRFLSQHRPEVPLSLHHPGLSMPFAFPCHSCVFSRTGMPLREREPARVEGE